MLVESSSYPHGVKDERRPRFVVSFGYAFRGIRWMLRHEPNMRFHLLATAGVIVAAAALRVPPEQWAALTFAISLVLLGEILNTAIEAVLDIVQPEYHDLVEVVKDVAAAAVLVAALGATVIACIIFGPRFWNLVF